MAEMLKIGEYEITRIVTGSEATNCFIVYHEPTNEMLLIDPGDEPRKISRALNENLGELRYILLTHAHHQNAGAAARISDEYSVPCAVQKGDLRLLRCMPQTALEEVGRVIEAPMGYRAFEGEPEFYFAGEQFFVTHTPGHTAGSVCYRFNGFVFTGDTLNHKTMTDTDCPGACPEKLDASIKKLFENCENNTVIFPGRGASWQLKQAKQWWEKTTAKELELEIS